ncbi:unnamed protein product [Candidula unifasciata]|uniref:Methyltransferase type 11 domain-containing protein n=1 Tax=Candidula unifasciata TaxID=100452 RepID=A0A8S3YXU5_9EUPU|nr:unnamed protein product [Candidula unifasciata]
MANRIRNWFVDQVGKNLKLPQSWTAWLDRMCKYLINSGKGWGGRRSRNNGRYPSFLDWITCKYFERRNAFLETNAVHLSNIKPDHKVLEIGFGPGLGLEAAYNIVKNGKGQVFGIDTSLYMVQKAHRRLKAGVHDKKVFLFHGSATQIPLNTDSVNRVFHCNCYYFWPSMRSVMREIYRVMQPGGVMVTTLSIDNLKKSQERGFLRSAHPDPVMYMQSLENYGFENVHLEYHTDPQSGKKFQAIFSEINEKPAHDPSMYNDDEDDIEKELQKMFESRIAERKQFHDKRLPDDNKSPLKTDLNITPGTVKS